MRKCPACNSEVSILAERCRFCGKPLPHEELEGGISKPKKPKPSSGKGRNFWKVTIFALLAGVLLFRLATLMMSESHIFKKVPALTKSAVEKPGALPAETASAKPVDKTPAVLPPAEEPNFISVNGKVVPNPKKRSSPSQPVSLGPPAPASGGEEPNFISVNGKVIPNPKKQRNPGGNLS